MSLFFVMVLEMVMESSIMLKVSLIRRNVSLKLCGYSLFLWFPKGEKPMCRKRENFVVKWKRVNHSSN